MSVDELDILLIEDNSGDARLIKEMLRDAETLLQRVAGGASTTGGLQIHHEQRLSTGLELLSEIDVDVVLLDLGLPETTGLDTLTKTVEATEFVPIVVLTGLRDEDVGIQAIQHGAQDYLIKDEVTRDLLVRSIHYAIERNRQERQRAEQLEQLEALNRLNRISQEITHDVITTSTREDLERAVCERLVDSSAYRFAWIGEVDQTSDQIAPRAAAGVEDGYLDEITVTVDGSSHPLVKKAVETHEVQVVQNTQTDPAFEPWREEAAERGYRSSAAVPIVYEDVRYGVVNVYAASPNAFSQPEIEILSRLGDVIGHAITAIERKDALVSDRVLEFEFQAEDTAEELVALSVDRQCSIEFENFIQNNGILLAYGSIDGVPWEEFQDAAERVNGIDDVRILTSEGDEYDFELVSRAVSGMVSAIATHGGRVTSATIADGEFRFVVEFPLGRDKRQLIDLVKKHCTGATVHAQRTVQRRDREGTNPRSILQDRLTEKQYVALKTAYFAGFFDWPRTSTGEELADRLGIAPATFTKHLRTAKRKFFNATFEDEQVDDRTDSSPWTSLESDLEDR